ncbi:MAG: DUF983 domain-containing protein [Alphaproteobacteria bacterium]|nr:DUF983 domain-containing protein [Alphaproteobacteria bacterium]
MNGSYPNRSSFFKVLWCRCPRCGQASLFKGFLTVTDQCLVCHLSFKNVDSGDGPAFLAVFILGALVVVMALYLDSLYHPPLWVHYVIWFPFTLISTIGLLRPIKAWWILMQYRYKASNWDDTLT